MDGERRAHYQNQDWFNASCCIACAKQQLKDVQKNWQHDIEKLRILIKDNTSDLTVAKKEFEEKIKIRVHQDVFSSEIKDTHEEIHDVADHFKKFQKTTENSFSQLQKNLNQTLKYVETVDKENKENLTLQNKSEENKTTQKEKKEIVEQTRKAALMQKTRKQSIQKNHNNTHSPNPLRITSSILIVLAFILLGAQMAFSYLNLFTQLENILPIVSIIFFVVGIGIWAYQNFKKDSLQQPVLHTPNKHKR